MGTQQRILEAAERLFAAQGFHAVGVDAIGSDAGLSGSAIYRHFSSKDEILAALFDAATSELLVRLGPPLALDEELVHLVDVHLDFTLERSLLSMIWQHEQRSLTDAYRRSFARAREHYVDRWMTALAMTYPDQSRDVHALAMNAAQAAIMSVTLRPRSAGSAETRAVVRSLVLAGLDSLCGVSADAGL